MEALFRKYFWSFHLAFLAVAAFIAAHTANAVLGHFIATDVGLEVRPAATNTKDKPQKSVKRDFDAVNDRNIFGAKREEILPPGMLPPGEAAEEEEEISGDWNNATPTELRLRLVGTAVFEFPSYSLASVSESGKKSLARALNLWRTR